MVTVNITSSGVSPSSVQVRVGGRVRFVNQSGAVREMSSDPHPIHTECPPLNIGPLSQGQGRETGAFNQARGCSYHDHGDPGNPLWWGSVTVTP